MAEVNLSDLFTAISQAMLDAHQAVTRSTLDQYWDYFRPSRLSRDGRMGQCGETEDALVPVTRKVVIPRRTEMACSPNCRFRWSHWFTIIRSVWIR